MSNLPPCTSHQVAAPTQASQQNASQSQAYTIQQITTIQPSNERWYRLGSLLFDAILPAFKTVLHNDNQDTSYTGLSRNEHQLYQVLSTTHKPTLDQLLRKKVMNQTQYDILLPPTHVTRSDDFDITLTVMLIRNVIQLPCKSKHWKYDEIAANDRSMSANVIRGRELRNFLCHHDPGSVDQLTFDNKWAEGEQIIKDLKFNCNLQQLRTQCLDSTSAKNTISLIALEKCVKNVESKADAADKKADTADMKAEAAQKDATNAEIKAEAAMKDAKTAKMIAESVNVKVDKIIGIHESKTEEMITQDTDCFMQNYKTDLKRDHPDDPIHKLIKRRFKPSTCPETSFLTHSAVLVQGEAGIGKSIYSRNIEVKWANGEIYQESFLLSFKCKDMNGQITKPPNIAPIYFSRAKDVVRYRREDELKTLQPLKSHLDSLAAEGKLIINIDGIDEVLIDHYLTKEKRDHLQQRVEENLPITGLETLMSILYGYLFEGSKVIVFGRDIEINNLKEVKEVKASAVFHSSQRQDLKLLPFTNNDVRKLTCLKVCGCPESNDDNGSLISNSDEEEDTLISNSDKEEVTLISESDEEEDTLISYSDEGEYTSGSDEEDNFSGSDEKYNNFIVSVSNDKDSFEMHAKCKCVHDKFRDLKFSTIPSYTAHLINIFQKDTWKNIKMTKTNLQVAVLFNQLLNHTELGIDKEHKTFESMFPRGTNKYKDCIKNLTEISRAAILHSERKIIGEKQKDGTYTYYNVPLDEKICAKLDLFYVRTEDFQHSLEPYHLTTLEFLAACAFVAHKEQWNELLGMKKERAEVILPFMSGLMSGSHFMKDFVMNGLDIDVIADINGYYEWLFKVDAKKLPNNRGWYGWADNKVTPSFRFLDTIALESQHPPSTLLPQSLVFEGGISQNVSKDLFEMEYVHKFYDFNNEPNTNLETFCKLYPEHNVVIDGWIGLDNNEDVSILNRAVHISNVQVNARTIYVGSSVTNEELMQILPRIGKLNIDAGNSLLGPVVDAIAGQLPNVVDVHLRTLIIRDFHKCNLNEMYRVLDAAIHVDLLDLDEWQPTDEQCAYMEEIRDNGKYKNVMMLLDNITFDEDGRTIEFLSQLRHLALRWDELDTEFFKSYRKPCSNPLEITRFYKQHKDSFILHQYMLFDGYRLARYNKVSELLGKEYVLSHMVLWLQNTKVENVSPDTLSHGLTNVLALCLDRVTLTDEQWDSLSDVVKTRCGALREIRLVEIKPLPWKLLVRLCQLPLLQIICENANDIIEFIRFFITNVTNMRTIRVMAGYEGLTDWVEEVIYNDQLSNLKSVSNIQKLESDIRDEKYHLQRTCEWACELSTPRNKGKCSIM